MKYFRMNPEVCGWDGPKSVVDASRHPPVVHKLDYEFEGWMGDALISGFPCYLGTDDVVHTIQKNHLTGVEVDHVDVSFSEEYLDNYGEPDMPHWNWLKIVGKHGVDDFGIGQPPLRLVVSEKALNALRKLGIEHAVVESHDK